MAEIGPCSTATVTSLALVGNRNDHRDVLAIKTVTRSHYSSADILELLENWMDRDVVAAIKISWRGRLRFDRSKGGAAEAVKGNPTTTVIPGVDARS